jgi:hypothetical protein
MGQLGKTSGKGDYMGDEITTETANRIYDTLTIMQDDISTIKIRQAEIGIITKNIEDRCIKHDNNDKCIKEALEQHDAELRDIKTNKLANQMELKTISKIILFIVGFISLATNLIFALSLMHILK